MAAPTSSCGIAPALCFKKKMEMTLRLQRASISDHLSRKRMDTTEQWKFECWKCGFTFDCYPMPSSKI